MSFLDYLTPQTWLLVQYAMLTALMVGFLRAAFSLYRQ